MVKSARVALLFPGQGAQVVGMGKAMAQAFPRAEAVFDEANDVLGYDLKRICFEGPEKELVLTNNSQPALLATSIACWKVFKEQGAHVDIAGCAGLSLGEYSALVIAGCLSYKDALLLVRARGTYMQEACELVPSGMASVIGLELAKVSALCEEISGDESRWILDVANVNCPGQIVISGHREAVQAAADKLAAMEGVRAVVLNVSGAFHSRLMQPAADKLRETIAQFNIILTKIPVFANVTGARIAPSESIADLLIRQITSPVLWEQCVRAIIEQSKPDLFIEVGSGKVLSGLLRRIDRSAKSCNIEDPESLAKTIGNKEAALS